MRLDKTLSAKPKKVLASSLSGLVGRISIDPNQGRTNVYETVDVGNVNTATEAPIHMHFMVCLMNVQAPQAPAYHVVVSFTFFTTTRVSRQWHGKEASMAGIVPRRPPNT